MRMVDAGRSGGWTRVPGVRGAALRVCAVLSALLFLTGCPSEPDPGPTPQPPPKPQPPPAPPRLPQNIVDAVVQTLFGRKRLRFKRDKNELEKQLEDQHRGYFIRRRTRQLLGENVAWLDNEALLTQRVDAEYEAVSAYVEQQLAPDRLGGAVEGGSPPRGQKTAEFVAAADKHLNLEDVAYATARTQDALARKQAATLVQLRRRRVKAIVWRAAAVHDEVWAPRGRQLGPSAALEPERIGELLDRR
jgi:hypothetical protein